MNILVLAHRIPYPPDKGCKIRAHHWIAHLAKRHNVWCACFIDDPNDEQNVDPLKRLCTGVLPVRLNRSIALLRGAVSLATGRSVTEGFLRSSEMSQGVRKLCRQVPFDAALAYSSGMVPYLLNEVTAARKVADYCDLDGMKWLAYAQHAAWPQSALFRREGERVLSREQNWARQLDAVTVISRSEAKDLHPTNPAHVHVVPNGCVAPNVTSPASAAGPIVTFFGMMDYKPNIDAVTWFARDIWPVVYAKRNDAVFQIAGRRPTRQVMQLNSLPGVRVLGEVNDRDDLLSNTAVSVAPLRIARGIQNKVLEAMAAHRPVVLTSPAADGIDAVPGLHYDVADSSETIAARILHYLNDPTARDTTGDTAANYVAQHFNWQREGDRLEMILLGHERHLEASTVSPHARQNAVALKT